jgi:hypothetical protein
MTPSQQRNLLLALLAAGALIVVTVSLIALTRSRRDIDIAAPADTAPASSGGFTFFDVSRTTVLDRDLRDRLSEVLGSDAIAHATPIDLTIVDQVDRLSIFSLILRFTQGSQFGHPAVKVTQASKISVTAVEGSLPAHADGETLCEAGESLVLENLPQALEVIVPADGVGEAGFQT